MVTVLCPPTPVLCPPTPILCPPIPILCPPISVMCVQTHYLCVPVHVLCVSTPIMSADAYLVRRRLSCMCRHLYCGHCPDRRLVLCCHLVVLPLSAGFNWSMAVLRSAVICHPLPVVRLCSSGLVSVKWVFWLDCEGCFSCACWL